MISVVIPTYNPKNYLSKVIKNKVDILNSSNLIYEIIIVNDGSTKNLDLYKNIKKEFINIDLKIYKQKNKGVSGARNYGVKKTQYEFIAFCDSDDMWDSRKLTIDFSLMINNNLDLIGSGLRFNGKSNFLRIKKLYTLNQMIKWGPHISSLIIKKDLFNKISGFRKNMRYAEDGDFLLRIIKSIGYVPYVEWDSTSNIDKKKPFGVQGLSASIYSMYKGELNCITKNLSLIYYLFIPLLSVKFLIRKIKINWSS